MPVYRPFPAQAPEFDSNFRRAIQLGRLFFHSIPVASATATDTSDKMAGRRISPEPKPELQSSEKVLNDVVPGKEWHPTQFCRMTR